jgi:ABC-2 type transport system permease protein
VRALIAAELRSRRRSLAGVGTGCFVALMALVGTYTFVGGQQGFAETFGAANASKLISAFAGSPPANVADPTNFVGFCFSHPILLLLVISVAVSSGAAAVATDVESGRAEMLFPAPISRTAVLAARVVAWLIAQAIVLGCAILGALTGIWLSADLSSVSPAVPLRLAIQLAGLLFFLGSAAFAVSACTRSRGTALGVAVGIAAASYTANLVALLWHPLHLLRHLTPFGYYNATAAATGVHWLDVVVLVDGGVLLLLLSRWWLEARDLT